MLSKLEDIQIPNDILLSLKKTPKALIKLVAWYVDIAPANQTKLIKDLGEYVVQEIEKRASEYPLAWGLKNLVISLSSYLRSEFDRVEEAGCIAAKAFQEHQENTLLGVSYFILGANNRSVGKLDKAVRLLIQGQDLIPIDSIFGVYKSYSNYQLAEISVFIKDYKSAEDFYNKTIELSSILNHNKTYFRAYTGLGNLYLSTGELELSKKYIDLSLELKGLTKAQKSKAYCDLGRYYFLKDDLTKAKELLQTSLDLRISAGLEDASVTSSIKLVEVLIRLGELDKAEQLLKDALMISKKYKSKNKEIKLYRLLAELNREKKDWEAASNFYQKYINQQEQYQRGQLRKIYEYKNDLIVQQKQVIEEMHINVQSSISYSKHIQTAFLPSLQKLKENLGDTFVLFKPKDIVSGDFYWFRSVENTIFLAVADCTGHGVPGAMMSVLCNSILDRCIQEFELRQPAEILDKARDLMIRKFDENSSDMMDGMDISLIKIENNSLCFAGAYNPLIVIRNQEILQFKGDRQPIGRYQKMTPFTTQQFELKEDDKLYLFSDGFQDQFGGTRNKKFGYKRLLSFLLKIHEYPLEEQEFILLDVLIKWKQDYDQIDDICVLGFCWNPSDY
ncbi:MAG: SpoIIE family protein phosphatase [Cytophagales bacterium]|nr:SpoIIE family protein phosphatase [Cytophagales bacterium]